MNNVPRSMTAAAMGLMLAGCASSVSTTSSGSRGGVEGDKSRIEQSLETMDRYEDRSIPMAKMEGLIADGLYDPENENPLKVGEPAPDFELMPLRFYDFAIDRGIDKTNAGSLFEPVRLSSFRGNLPVVLIFGSYT